MIGDTMGFADALQVEHDNAFKGPSCTIGITIAAMDTGEAADLCEALDDLLIPASQIARALKAENYKIASEAVRRHRNRECKCRP